MYILIWPYNQIIAYNYNYNYMCVGDDRHCLGAFVHSGREIKKELSSGHHFYDLLLTWNEVLVFVTWDTVFGLLCLTHAGQTLGLVPGSVSIYAGHLLDRCLVLIWRSAVNYVGIMLGVIIMRLGGSHRRFMLRCQLLHWLPSLRQVVRLSVH